MYIFSITSLFFIASLAGCPSFDFGDLGKGFGGLGGNYNLPPWASKNPGSFNLNFKISPIQYSPDSGGSGVLYISYLSTLNFGNEQDRVNVHLELITNLGSLNVSNIDKNVPVASLVNGTVEPLNDYLEAVGILIGKGFYGLSSMTITVKYTINNVRTLFVIPMNLQIPSAGESSFNVSLPAYSTSSPLFVYGAVATFSQNGATIYFDIKDTNNCLSGGVSNVNIKDISLNTGDGNRYSYNGNDKAFSCKFSNNKDRLSVVCYIDYSKLDKSTYEKIKNGSLYSEIFGEITYSCNYTQSLNIPIQYSSNTVKQNDNSKMLYY